MSEPTKEQFDATFAVGQLRHLYKQMLSGAVKDTAEAARGLLGPAIEKLEPLTTPALAPPAQTQRPDLVRLAHLYEHSDPDCEIPGCSCCPALIELLNKVAAPLNLEKQPSPAAAPAQLSALATAQRGLDEWCKAAMQERARADAAEAKLAALAGQPAPTAPINQCDGCRAGRPIDKNGNHRMGDGDYPNLQACQRHLYYQPAPTDDQKALRAAAMEEAAKLVEDADEGAHGQDYQLGDVAEFRHRVATEIRALAGSPAQQGQLGKEGVK